MSSPLGPQWAPFVDSFWDSASIGIWVPNAKSDRYRRSHRWLDEWPLWADVHSIPARSDLPRIVLLGESAARGYMCDPVTNPATMLASALTDESGQPMVDVVDLARTNATCRQVLEIARSSMMLEPRVLLVFGGNNWKFDVLSASADQRMAFAEELTTGGVAGLRRVLEAAIAEQTSWFVEQLVEIAGPSVSVVVAVPEVNLADWWSPTLEPVGDEASRAERNLLRSKLDAALDRSDWPEVATLASALETLAGGAWAMPAEARARAARATGKEKEARDAIRTARDAHLWHVGIDAPGLPAVAADAMRSTAEACGATTVDLRTVLGRHCPGRIPGRSEFLDYCHLNPRGMREVAATIAAVTAPLLDLPVPSARELVDRIPVPSAEDQAATHLAAAIHNARHSQPPEIVRFHCAEALSHAATIEPLMAQVFDLVSRPAPPWMVGSIGGVIRDCPIHLGKYLQDFSVTPKVFYGVLTSVLADCIGRPESVRAEFAARPGSVVDLLEAGLAPGWFAPDWQWLLPGRSPERDLARFMRAHTQVVELNLVVGEPAPVALHLCLRSASQAGALTLVEVNGEAVEEVEVSSVWTTHSLAIAPHALQRGSNVVRLVWAEDAASNAPTRWDTDAFEDAWPDLSIVYGDIASATATVTG